MNLVYKHRFYFLAALFGLILTLISTVSVVQAAAMAPTAKQSRQCKKIVQALERDHFTGKKVDHAISSMVFDRYIKYLDPTRHLLTQNDMDEFLPFKHLMYRYVQKGNLDPAFEIFNRYQSRRLERLNYILNAIETWKSDLDFDRDETLVIDPDTAAFVQTPNDLTDCWRKELKNHIISLKLDGKTDTEISDTLKKIYTHRRNRLDQVNGRDVFQFFMSALTSCFDPHTQYFPPRASEDFDIQMSLSLEGIGAVLQNEYEYTKVVRIIPKGPADKSHKLMPGDKIIGVGQGNDGEIKDTIGQRIDDVVKLIRGPKDTFVRLKIIPAKNANDTTIIRIKRDKVKLEEQSAQQRVEAVTVQGQTYKIGIIEVPNFYIDFQAYHRGDDAYKSTSRDVAKLLTELKKENIDGLIMDLRDNGGGSLKEANDLTGLFLKSGPTVQIKTKHRIARLYDQDPSIAYTGPLVVLINRMSASASEIFAGAIKDYNRGLIVGTRTFGKGTVQELKPLGEGRLKLTSAKFYRVSGQSTQHKGVAPDIALPQVYKVEDTGESALDGALLWDTITRTPFTPYRHIDPMFSTLKKEYEDRSAQDPGMAYLTQRIDMANRMGNITELSLNLAKRREMDAAQTQEELAMENELRAKQNEPPVEHIEDINTTMKEFKEILMKQTEYLAADYIRLTRKLGYTW